MAVQDSQGEDTFYPDDLLPKIQQVLAIMADLERRYETDRYHLENWSGPRAIKAHVLADLDRTYKANRERYEVCLEDLRLRTRAHIECLRRTQGSRMSLGCDDLEHVAVVPSSLLAPAP